MYKYRVIGHRMTGNAKRLYKIEDIETGEVFEKYASFFGECGNDAFINVSVRGKSSFTVLKSDKGTKAYQKNMNRLISRYGENGFKYL